MAVAVGATSASSGPTWAPGRSTVSEVSGPSSHWELRAFAALGVIAVLLARAFEAVLASFEHSAKRIRGCSPCGPRSAVSVVGLVAIALTDVAGSENTLQ